MFTQQARILLGKLCEIANAGPLRAVGHGSTAVGMTLLDALGVGHTSTDKPRFMGIVVTARRDGPTSPSNRVNLFARVPDWRLSACKSSSEIAARHGYDAELGVRKLYCTIRARHPNSQGLVLAIDRKHQTLNELFVQGNKREPVATWRLADLKGRLATTHPESMWVTANVVERNGIEHFHYRRAVYTGQPVLDRLEALLEEGTVTVDHLIEIRDGNAREKGPLFKITPKNIPMLFPEPLIFDLLNVDPARS